MAKRGGFGGEGKIKYGMRIEAEEGLDLWGAANAREPSDRHFVVVNIDDTPPQQGCNHTHTFWHLPVPLRTRNGTRLQHQLSSALSPAVHCLLASSQL